MAKLRVQSFAASLAVRPILLGAGEHLLEGIDARALGYQVVKHVAGERALHVSIRRRMDRLG